MKTELNVPRAIPCNEEKEVLFHGVPASPGIAIGPIRLIERSSSNLSGTAQKLSEDQVDAEIAVFEKALQRTKDEIIVLQEKLRQTDAASEANIFNAQLLIASDKMLISEVNGLIRKQFLPAETAFRRTIQRYIAAISSLPDQFLRERSDDIKDVATRIINHINGLEVPKQDTISEPVVIIAKDLTPSDTAN